MNIIICETGASVMMRKYPSSLLLISVLFWASVAFRALVEAFSEDTQLAIVLVALFALYMLLWATVDRLAVRWSWYPGVYLTLQTSLVAGMFMLPQSRDYYSVLFMPLSTQVMWMYPQRKAYIWIGVFALTVTLGMFITQGWPSAVPFALLYSAAFIFIASFSTLTERAESARSESQRLYAELQIAHQRLQEYAAQAEQLAVAQERSRLSRDLHDSVTQLLYSLTLHSAAATRQLGMRNHALVEEQLDQIRTLGRQALQEMRLLVFELRPAILEQEGLAGALRARLESVESRSGLKTDLHVEGAARLRAEVETSLYRIAQEALNNIIKHARAQRVTIDLYLDRQPIVLEISDDGAGFDPQRSDGNGGLGLRGMRERAEQLGSHLSIESAPGNGTRVRVEYAA